MSRCRISDALRTIAVLAIACVGASSIYGQETTERYIPIGKSPGVSDKYSFIGTITAIDRSEHTIEIDSNRGKRTVKVTEDTHIWVDRTKLEQTNTVGSYSDCEVGRKIEVMHVRGDETVAEWIKIEGR